MNIALTLVMIALVVALLIPLAGIVKNLLDEAGVDTQSWIDRLTGRKPRGE